MNHFSSTLHFFIRHFWFINVGSIIAFSIFAFIQQEISFFLGLALPTAVLNTNTFWPHKTPASRELRWDTSTHPDSINGLSVPAREPFVVTNTTPSYRLYRIRATRTASADRYGCYCCFSRFWKASTREINLFCTPYVSHVLRPTYSSTGVFSLWQTGQVTLRLFFSSKSRSTSIIDVCWKALLCRFHVQ